MTGESGEFPGHIEAPRSRAEIESARTAEDGDRAGICIVAPCAHDAVDSAFPTGTIRVRETWVRMIHGSHLVFPQPETALTTVFATCFNDAFCASLPMQRGWMDRTIPMAGRFGVAWVREESRFTVPRRVRRGNAAIPPGGF